MIKMKRIWIYGLLGVAVVAALVMTSEKGQSAKSSAKATTLRRKAVAASEFTAEDRKASFNRLNEKPRNAFKPLVARSSSMAMALAPNGVPAELTGGDPNWFYTGTAIIDDSPTALIENPVTGEAEFLKQGATWKHAHVVRILPNSLVLGAPNGREHVLKLVEPGAEIITENGSGFRPVNPQLSGPIGGAIAVQPSGNRGNSGTTAKSRASLETRNAN